MKMHDPLAPRCAVDWRALQRFDLPLANLPEGCAVQFREPGFLEKYRYEAAAVALVLVTQTALIIAFLVQSRRRKLAEAEMNTQRRQLAHAGRLAAIGELSASIAHEISQPLAAMLSNAEAGESLVAAGRIQPAELQEIFASIREDDLRASAVIDRMRRMSRREPVEARAVDLNEVVETIVRLTAGLARAHEVTVTTELDKTIPAVKGDFVQMQQVLLNLLMNAIDAVSEVRREKRLITIRTTLQQRDAVEVCVTDAGRGIPAEQLSRVFEPFYSSKPNGLGLGLSISRSIVHAHRGRIWAESHDSGGATFRFSIPV
jgi:C4-dicarboxylate-specific signal transduction histidine kinase